MMNTLWRSFRILPFLITLWRSVSGETGRNGFQAKSLRIAAARDLRSNSSSDRVKLTHVLEHEINVPIVVRLVKTDQSYDVVVIGER